MLLPNISFNAHPVLGDLKLNLCNNEGQPYKIVLLVGENGCGKTTVLKELYGYEGTKMSIVGETPYDAVFIRQDHKYCSAIDEISTKISSEKVFEKYKEELSDGQNVFNSRLNLNVNSKNFLNEKIKEFKNSRLNDIVDKLSDLSSMYKQVSSLVKIDKVGYADKYIDLYSSGEQEFLILLKELRLNITYNTDIVLIDEPETSLHPKWQLKILDFIKESLKDVNDNIIDVQIFIATHSENILKQAIKDKDILIIQMYKEGNIIKSKPVSEMDLRLPQPTYSEMQYIIFDIPNSDYHNLLISEIIEKNNFKTLKKADDFIASLSYYDESKHARKSKGKGKVCYKTLPVFIRNKYHHPEISDIDFTEEQLRTSIELLRQVLSNQ